MGYDARVGGPARGLKRETRRPSPRKLASYLGNQRQHPSSLPGIEIPDEIRISTDPLESINSADVVVIAVPTQKLRTAVVPIAELLRGKLVVSAIKGLELDSLQRATAVIEGELGQAHGATICALSGPNLSSEIAAGRPAATVIASTSAEGRSSAQRALMSGTFRVYLSNDVIGVEMGGALKNIIAIGAGIGDGLGAGDNARAAFLTRGIAEIARLGVACGADAQTFAGLSGIGDLIATCSSSLSRNHRVGMGLAAGQSLDAVFDCMHEVAEGVATTYAAYALGQQLGSELPIVEQMYGVLYEGVSPMTAIARLMEREPRGERDDDPSQDQVSVRSISCSRCGPTPT